ncbi:MAG: arylsulfatase [Lautropia sp.]|nr:arylsulfatase [Lautropia sp.]
MNTTPTSERKRIALIHALTHSSAPVQKEFQRQWPECRLMNLLDDSLSADLAGRGGLDEAMYQRFQVLGDYAVETGADAILFTCSAFGPCIEAVARRHPGIPVLKPNEAMIAQAVRLDTVVGLVASFSPTLNTMPAEFPAGSRIDCELADGALAALDAGALADHDRLVVEAAAKLHQRGCGAIALVQFSLARAADAVAAAVPLPVLTTVGSAVAELRARLLGPKPA